MTKKKIQLYPTLKPFLNKHNFRIKFLSQKEREKYLNVWLKRFSSQHHLPKHEALWHYINRYKKGDKAIECLEKTYFKNFIIFSQHSVDAIKCTAPHATFITFIELEKFLRPNIDIIISHTNLHWTFIVTHDEFFGPFYISSKE